MYLQESDKNGRLCFGRPLGFLSVLVTFSPSAIPAKIHPNSLSERALTLLNHFLTCCAEM